MRDEKSSAKDGPQTAFSACILSHQNDYHHRWARLILVAHYALSRVGHKL